MRYWRIESDIGLFLDSVTTGDYRHRGYPLCDGEGAVGVGDAHPAPVLCSGVPTISTNEGRKILTFGEWTVIIGTIWCVLGAIDLH
jgi:hypothetical protein